MPITISIIHSLHGHVGDPGTALIETVPKTPVCPVSNRAC